MNNFGLLKTKILQRLAESYESGKKDDIKEILTLIIKNKDFRDMYIFYEEIENKYIEDKESAKMYVEEASSLLKQKSNKILKFCKSLDRKIGDVHINENEIYSYVDLLIEDDNLVNIDKKILGKRKLIEHLTTKKDNLSINEDLDQTSFTQNENLLHAVLTNNFNVVYDNSLNEEEKKELKRILSLSNDKLKNNFNTLKEDISGKINKLILEEKNDEVLTRLILVKSEMNHMKISKFNYYKLQELKNGL